MARADADLLEMVGQLHEGLADETLWQAALGNVCQMLRFPFLLMGAISRGGTRVTFQFGHQVTPGAVALLEGPLADPAYNPWLALTHEHPLRRIATIDDIGGRRHLERARLWSDLYVPFNLGDSVGAALERQPGYSELLVAGRRGDQPAFSTDELEALGSLLPHIARAWRVRRGLVELEELTGTLTHVLDRLDRAIVIAGPDGDIRFANRAADKLLSRGDGLDATRGRIRASRPHHTNALRALIHRAAQTGIGADEAAVSAVALPRADADTPLAVVAEPLAPAHSDRIGQTTMPGAILFISDSQACSRPSSDSLCIVYGLTRTEARLTSLIVAGNDIGAAAEAMGTSPNTVKYHLKSVFGKVGVNRQAELVRRVLADVGGLAEPEKMRPAAPE